MCPPPEPRGRDAADPESAGSLLDRSGDQALVRAPDAGSAGSVIDGGAEDAVGAIGSEGDVQYLVVAAHDAGRRIDRLLAEYLPGTSRARVQDLIDASAVTVADRPVRPSYKVAPGDRVTVRLPAPAPSALEPEDIPIEIVYEDADLIVVEKPAGLVVHPAPGHPSGTLVNALLARCPDLEGIGGELRPGIVHRLDKDTSGLLVVAKNERAERHLAAQFERREIDKRYLALVDGAPASESGTIDAPIARDPRRPQQMAAVPGGRPATTHFRVIERYRRHTLLECKPVTGRTHQIRVHLAAIGCPVAGDRVYGARKPSVPLDRHFLHATRLSLVLPDGDQRTFESPLPADLARVLAQLQAD